MAHGKSELIDFLAGVLTGIVVSDEPFRSETALATALSSTPRRLQDLRRLGLVTPRRLGRGYVYGPGDVRMSSVLVGLMRLGATPEDLTAFLDHGATRCDRCPAKRADGPCGLARCCEIFLEDLRARTEDEIARLKMLDGLLQQYAVDVWQENRPRRTGS
jgi:hypothetical protein